MKKYSSKYFTLIICIFCFTFVSLKHNTEFSKDPKIAFTETVYDFGKVEQGTELTHSFEFKNAGTGILEITGVRTSCGCTGAVLDGKKEYKRNETGEIKVKFNTQGRMGILSKTIMVSSNDPSNPVVTLTIACDIYTEKQ